MIERFFVFAKAQVSSFVGGMVDYSVMIFFTEIFHVYYPISIAISGVIGAVVNFSLNKTWTFRSKTAPYKFSFIKQLSRFVLVVINSILLKMSGTYLFTTYVGIDYKISRLITDLIVSLVFNYGLQRHWVFKREHAGSINKEINVIKSR
jgi:putative flippase GtrA